MKKSIHLILFLTIIVLLVGCSQPNTSNKNATVSKKNAITVTIVLKEKQQEFERKTLTVNNKATLQAVMLENFSVETNKGLIISIAGKEQDNAKQDTKGCYWIYDINGTPAMVGANDTELKNGDEIVWNLSAA